MNDEFFMRIALEEAREAFSAGEVPIGAAAVVDGQIAARAHNRMVERGSVLGHAEIELLRELERQRGDWRMENVTVYVTKEPCAMCAGAMVNARIKRLVFGLPDPRCGAAGSSPLDVCRFPGMLWQLECQGGILETSCRELIQNFFKQVREQKNHKNADPQN